MKKLSRRDILGSAGLVAGASLMTGCNSRSQASPQQEKPYRQGSTDQKQPEANIARSVLTSSAETKSIESELTQ